MARVVGGYAAADNRVPVAMTANFGVFNSKILNNCAPFVAPFVTGFAPRDGGFGSGFVAASTRRKENNSRQHVVCGQRPKYLCRGHFGHVQFQCSSLGEQWGNG